MFCERLGSSVLLTEQATFCLSSGHSHCPLYTKAQKEVGSSSRKSSIAGAQTSGSMDAVSHAIVEMEEDPEHDIARAKQRKRWGWIGALSLFLSSLVCGGSFAAYLGWRLVNSDNLAVQAGTVTTLSEPATPATTRTLPGRDSHVCSQTNSQMLMSTDADSGIR